MKNMIKPKQTVQWDPKESDNEISQKFKIEKL